MKFTQEYSYKLILILKTENEGRHEIKADLNKSLKENFINFSNTTLAYINTNKANDTNLNSELKIILEHLQLCKVKSDSYVGRYSLLQTVHDFILQNNMQHLIITGESGAGIIFENLFLHTN